MKRNNYYDVTDWQVGNPYTDIGEVINSIIADIKNRQKDTNVNDGGKPGAVIYIPSGDYHLKTHDFQLPMRFELEYTGADGEKHRPIMIHRVVFGSIERFIGILTEHFAGAFPIWLAPVQVELMPIADRHNEFTSKVAAELKKRGIRVEVDGRSEKIGFKIREAQLQKIPYMLVIGDKEVETENVSIRCRKRGDR